MLLSEHQRTGLNSGVVLICQYVLHYISNWIRGAEIIVTEGFLYAAQVTVWDSENTHCAVRFLGSSSLYRCLTKMTFA